MLKIYNTLFKKNASYEGHFQSSPTKPSPLFGELTDGLARIELLTNASEENPRIRMTLAESNHIDSRIATFDISFNLATVDITQSLIRVSILAGSRDRVITKIQETLQTTREVRDHDLLISLIFKPATSQTAVGKDDFEHKDVIMFGLDSEELGVQTSGEVKRGKLVEAWHLPALPWRTYLKCFFITVFLGGVSIAAYLQAKKELEDVSVIQAQGSVTWVCIFWINAHFLVLTIRYFGYVDAWTKLVYAFIGAWLIFQILFSALIVYHLVENMSDHTSKVVNTIWLIGFSLWKLYQLRSQEDILNSESYTFYICTFYGYPLFQACFISFCSNSSKDNYFKLGMNGFMTVGALILLWIYHGSEMETMKLKKRSSTVFWAICLSVIGTLFIFLQSRFGRQFYLNRPDPNEPYVNRNSPPDRPQPRHEIRPDPQRYNQVVMMQQNQNNQYQVRRAHFRDEEVDEHRVTVAAFEHMQIEAGPGRTANKTSARICGS